MIFAISCSTSAARTCSTLPLEVYEPAVGRRLDRDRIRLYCHV
jgi:hypothetical protein